MLEEIPSIAVLAPYRLQAKLLTGLVRDMGLRKQVRVGTVHRFQGSEQDGVILDLVVGPPGRLPGRMLEGASGRSLLTVGMSRRRGKLVVVADAHLRRNDPTRRLLEPLPEYQPALKRWRYLCKGGGSIEFFPDASKVGDTCRAELDESGFVWAPPAPANPMWELGFPSPSGTQVLVRNANGLLRTVKRLGWLRCSPTVANTPGGSRAPGSQRHSSRASASNASSVDSSEFADRAR